MVLFNVICVEAISFSKQYCSTDYECAWEKDLKNQSFPFSAVPGDAILKDTRGISRLTPRK